MRNTCTLQINAFGIEDIVKVHYCIPNSYEIHLNAFLLTHGKNLILFETKCSCLDERTELLKRKKELSQSMDVIVF